MDRGLAYIGKVTQVIPIEGADKIESLEVFCGEGGAWRGTAQKGQFTVNSSCRVFLQDSQLPQTEEFKFMESKNYRVRMMKLRGVPSEVLIMPILFTMSQFYEVGANITEAEKVTKYEKPVSPQMAGQALGRFPSFIPKTDEENFQTATAMVKFMQGKQFYSSVKVDGSSATVYYHDGHFGCCSRNLELKETEGNHIWNIARKYKLEEYLKDKDLALQFEVAGLGIQKNPLGFKEIQPFLFNVYDIKNMCYLGIEEIKKINQEIGFPMIDIIDYDKTFTFQADDELRKYAEGNYPNGKPREGVVIRPMVEASIIDDLGRNRGRVSFKSINLLYKD